jgi:hypothetical protein
MTPHPDPPAAAVATLSLAELMALVQDPATPGEVLKEVLELPALSPDVLGALLHHPQIPVEALAALAERAEGPLLDVLLGDLEHVERWLPVLEALLRNAAVPATTHQTLQRHLEAARKREVEGAKKNLLLRIKDLPVGQKLALAKKGNKDVRMILVKDSNEMVALEVVASPRITDGEILAIAQMRDVTEKVLRYIANHKKYRQNHQIVVSLLNNPRTPVGVSLGLGIYTLSDRELADLAKNRNVPGVVARAAKQVLDRRKAPKAQAGGGH